MQLLIFLVTALALTLALVTARPPTSPPTPPSATLPSSNISRPQFNTSANVLQIKQHLTLSRCVDECKNLGALIRAVLALDQQQRKCQELCVVAFKPNRTDESNDDRGEEEEEEESDDSSNSSDSNSDSDSGSDSDSEEDDSDSEEDEDDDEDESENEDDEEE